MAAAVTARVDARAVAVITGARAVATRTGRTMLIRPTPACCTARTARTAAAAVVGGCRNIGYAGGCVADKLDVIVYDDIPIGGRKLILHVSVSEVVEIQLPILFHAKTTIRSKVLIERAVRRNDLRPVGIGERSHIVERGDLRIGVECYTLADKGATVVKAR